MSSINIKDLELIESVNDDDFLLVEQYNGTKKIKIRDLENRLNEKILNTLSERLKNSNFIK